MGRSSDVPVIERFSEIIDDTKHVDASEDASLLIFDIVDSTRAIGEGRYKEVNALGASAITAVLNATDKRLHYVFGGDGATFLVDRPQRVAAEQALLGVRELGRDCFGFESRVGRVPVRWLFEHGYSLRVARFKTSDTFLQTVLSGTGVGAAESLVRERRTDNPWLVSGTPAVADLTGLECRWSPIPSRTGQIISLLVFAKGTAAECRETYERVLEVIEREIGVENAMPLSEGRLKLARSFRAYGAETRARTWPYGRLSRVMYWVRIFILTRFYRLPDRYRAEVVRNSDYRKFDGLLRMVLESTPAQTSRLEAFLADLAARGRLAYGISRSAAAMMTCLILDRAVGEHFHFLDGTDGGYASAAAQLKEQLREVPV